MRGPDEKVKRRAKERSEGGVWVLGSSVWVPWALEGRLPLLFDSDMHMEFDTGALVASGGVLTAVRLRARRANALRSVGATRDSQSMITIHGAGWVSGGRT